MQAVIDDTMSLDEKLAAIDAAMASVEADNIKRVEQGDAPMDPALATICEGCE